MTDTFYEMPEQDFPMYKQPFLKMYHQHLLPIKTGHLELFFFNSEPTFYKMSFRKSTL